MSAINAARQCLNTGLSFLYPEICQSCRVERAEAADGYVCTTCRKQLRYITAPFCERCGLPFEGEIGTKFECANCQEMELHFTSARSAVLARELVLEIIHRYKYNRDMWFEPFLAGLLVREAGPALAQEKWDVIVPVPLHPAKRREREFNQAERLGARLSAATSLPMNKKLLRRVKPTQTQTALSRKQRAENMKKAFEPIGEARLKGERVVLVDDVFTTGATTSECARVLQAMGAGDVCVWTVARGL